ncbi:DinB family protein [Tessaracoccus sp. OH4464_COT-324]|uniref:DinB family protein n=1 Tax=Tessaracoccus sp. OH4464_COT-324 TaxID=2491059 RepID=UPI000F62C6A7|nr:DinB family protein [Tessaracoccus sp. OH4464_COT-324]RRD45614.1 DUF664 domain-containing protein [Tessaracoccus sp. OH4464_COT-324]
MQANELLADAASRPVWLARAVLDGLSVETAHAMPGDKANSIVWLLWHAARQLDVQLARLTARPTVWEEGRWSARLGVARAAHDFGLGDTPADVAALRVDSVAELGEHLAACVGALTEYALALRPDELDEVVDRSYTPPVTRGVRLVSLIDDATVHVGQAAYVRGLLDGWSLGV